VVPPGTCRLPEIDCRPAAPECHLKLPSAKASRSSKTIIAEPHGNFACANNRSHPAQKDQLAGFLIVPRF
jgi:hypothetical protein